ncbi:MAG: RecT family recombinase [bacterium]
MKYGNNPANIFTGRDGFLSIAHRSGQFDGMESGARVEGDEIIGWCKVYRKDMERPFTVEVALSEYSTGQNLWKTKPRTMIQKVAESQCLRRAFDISGLYSPEEFDQSTPVVSKITKEKASELFRLAKGNKDLVKEVIGSYGYKRTTDIGTDQYEMICEDILTAVREDEQTVEIEAEPPADMFSSTEEKSA